ncbi:hypothetical protein [Bryobacter aggregatus]|uniref:hypothetical protein n=1 Tax=Bryobacter aggregatus TaxID=360054 RepID=UPI0004E184EE|nr:hypothetical protein [Bryobacter aggregatus]
MSSYLDQYGAGEERRNKMIVRAVLAFVALIVLGIAGYYALRNHSEKNKLAGFREILEKQDYPGAYRYWGCTPEKPCRNYAYEKFLEDWGPKSGHTEFSKMQEIRKVTCKDGFGVGWKFPSDTLHLWIVREDQSMSYDPFPSWKQTWIAALFNDCSGMNRGLRGRTAM